MFTIICVYNNPELLKSWLMPDLCSNQIHYEKIFIDNSNNKFTSAAAAYNKAIASATGEYLLFIHQDVRFESENWLEMAESLIKNIKNAGVIGIAGMSEIGSTPFERGRNTIKYCDPPVIWECSNPIKEPTEVQTLDEFLFIVPRKLFEKLNFDQIVCDNWHLYTVDLCLAAKKLGFINYVIPLSTWHRGSQIRTRGIIKTMINFGHLPQGYYKTLKKVLYKYKHDYKLIYTTCGTWNTRQPLFIQRAVSLFLEGLVIIKSSLNKKLLVHKTTQPALQNQDYA